MATIKAGDLVMVVKPWSCCGGGKLGYVFRVHKTGRSSEAGIRCGFCRAILPPQEVVRWPDNGVTQLSRLIKIDPPAQPESIETRESITA